MNIKRYVGLVSVSVMAQAFAWADRPFKIDEMEFSGPGSGPTLIAGDSHGCAWIPLAKRSRIAKVDSSGSIIQEYELPNGAYPVGIAVDALDKVWFSDIKNNNLSRFDPATGEFKNYEIPTKGAWPFEVRIAADGRIWITERFANKFAVFDPSSGKFQEWNVETPAAQPAGLVVTPEGEVFFTQNSGHKIGHYSTRTGVYREITVPTEMKKGYHYGLAGIDRDAQNNIWFCVLDGKLGCISAQSGYNEVRFVDYPEAAARPGGLIVDAANDLWIGELDGNRIGHYLLKENRFERFPVPTGSPDPSPRAAPEVKAIAQDTGKSSASGHGETQPATRGDSPAESGNNKGAAPAVASAPPAAEKAPAKLGAPNDPSAAPAKTSRPFGLLAGKDGRIWFTEQYGNNVGILRVYDSLDSRTLSSEGRGTVDIPSASLGAQFIVGSHTTVYLVPGQRLCIKSDPKAPSGDFSVTNLEGLIQTSKTVEGGIDVLFPKKGKFHLTLQIGQDSRDFVVEVRDSSIPSIVYDLKGRLTVPGVVDAAPDGSIWFTDIGGFGIPGLGNLPPGDHIGRITSDGVVSEFQTPTLGSSPTSIKVGKDGKVWFTERLSDSIAKWDPATLLITEYPVPTAKSAPTGIAIDQGRGRIWFTEKASSQIGYLETATGKVIEIKTPTRPSEPSTIALAPDGMIWFDERAQGDVVRYDPAAGNFQIFSLASPEARSIGVTPYSASEGWFLELGGNKIGHLDIQSGQIVEYAIPTDRAFPFKLTRTSDGNIWFTEVFGNRVGRFSTQSGFKEFRAPLTTAYPGGITRAPNGDIVYALQGGSALVRIPRECIENYWALML